MHFDKHLAYRSISILVIFLHFVFAYSSESEVGTPSHHFSFRVLQLIFSPEICLSGDLKLVEKPQPVVMSPQDFTNIKASVKVASTENGIIFGNIGK